MNKPTLMIIDDEEMLLHFLAEALSDEFKVVAVPSARTALELLENIKPDILLLDVLLNGEEDGVQLCRGLRTRIKRAEAPILMFSGVDEPHVRISSFEAGADDYISKPFLLDELRVRLRNRRELIADIKPSQQASTQLSVGRLLIDLDRVEARIDGNPINLGPVEFKILGCLVRRQGGLCTRSEIEDIVWGKNRPTSRALDPHINSLRKKIAGSGLELRTIYGGGYSLRAPSSEAPINQT